MTTNNNAKSQSIADAVISILSTACFSGGPGSPSCSLSYEVSGEVVGTGGSVTISITQVCREGFYACCNAINGGSCKEEE